MTVEQISVFVENRSGQLGDVTRVLEKAGINIRALSLSDTTDFGVLRLMADDTEKARDALAIRDLPWAPRPWWPWTWPTSPAGSVAC